MQDWHHPKALKSLCGFLGLSSYYRKFVKNYGIFFSLLISLLNNNAFVWNEVGYHGISSSKDSMCSTIILAVPYLFKTFVLESDALGKGLGAVLIQEGCLLAITNK
jgi:hypothetical protein